MSETIVGTNPTDDSSELLTAQAKLDDAHALAHAVMEALPQLVTVLNRYAAKLGLPALAEISASVSTPETHTPGQSSPPVRGSIITRERSQLEQTTPKSHDYDIIAVLGSAFNFARKRFPKHVYNSLDNAAAMHNQGKSADGIVLCGRGAMKDIEKGLVTAESEARLMQKYLTRQGVDPDAITLEEASVNTPENFLFFKRLAEINGWEQVYLPTAADRVNRVAFLAAKICYKQCRFDIQGIPNRPKIIDEPKLLGDMVCTLQEMGWGDEKYIIDEDTGACKWKDMGIAHHTCDYYVYPKDIKPNHNYHPASLIREFGTPPPDAVTILK